MNIMATEIRKFVDQAGVSTLWAAVAAEVAKVDKKAVDNAAAIAINSGDIATMKGQIEALEKGTYDDSAVRELIQEDIDMELEEYNLEAITGGTDALAEVFVVSSDSHGNKSTGRSTNQDIVMASILAVLDYINKLLLIQRTQ
jgi:2-isopropylmalate synthase